MRSNAKEVSYCGNKKEESKKKIKKQHFSIEIIGLILFY